MKKCELLFAAGWVIAGLVSLHMVLGAQPPENRTVVDNGPLVESIRTSCELPAGTVVFVVRDPTEGAP